MEIKVNVQEDISLSINEVLKEGLNNGIPYSMNQYELKGLPAIENGFNEYFKKMRMLMLLFEELFEKDMKDIIKMFEKYKEVDLDEAAKMQ